jgi:hypothetical protein
MKSFVFTFKQNFASLKSLSFDFLQNWIEWIRRISEFDEPDVAGLFLQNDPLEDDTIERAKKIIKNIGLQVVADLNIKVMFCQFKQFVVIVRRLSLNVNSKLPEFVSMFVVGTNWEFFRSFFQIKFVSFRQDLKARDGVGDHVRSQNPA